MQPSSFVVTLVRGRRWNAALDIRDQLEWDAHAAFMDALVREGFLVLGGPVGDGRVTLHLVRAGSRDEVRRRFAADPWVSGGWRDIGLVEPWELWLNAHEKIA